jgi:hypothetical protein
VVPIETQRLQGLIQANSRSSKREFVRHNS